MKGIRVPTPSESVIMIMQNSPRSKFPKQFSLAKNVALWETKKRTIIVFENSFSVCSTVYVKRFQHLIEQNIFALKRILYNAKHTKKSKFLRLQNGLKINIKSL